MRDRGKTIKERDKEIEVPSSLAGEGLRERGKNH
jgi:hypothetical protein